MEGSGNPSTNDLTGVAGPQLRTTIPPPVSSKFEYPQIWVSRVPTFTKKWVPPYPYFQKYRYPRTYIYGK